MEEIEAVSRVIPMEEWYDANRTVHSTMSNVFRENWMILLIGEMSNGWRVTLGETVARGDHT